MINKLKMLMYLVIVVSAAVNGAGNALAMFVESPRPGRAAGLVNDLTRGEVNKAIPELKLATAKFQPAPLAGQTSSSDMVASMDITATIYGWAKTWGGSGDDMGEAVAVDRSGNVYVSGYFNGTVDFNPGSGVDSHTSNGGRDVFLSKFDAAGNFQWAKTWGGKGDIRQGSGDDRGEAVAVDRAGNVYVAGPFRGIDPVDFDPGSGVDYHAAPGALENDAFLSKFDANGTFKWAKTWGGTAGDEAYSLAMDGSDNAYVVGDFSSGVVDFNPGSGVDNHTNHGIFDAFLSKFASDGTFQWAKTWGGEGYDDGPGVAVDSLGNVYVGGMYASTDPNLNFDPAGGSGGLGHPAQDSGVVVDVFLSKFASNGTFLWVKTWGGPGTDEVGQTVMVDGVNNVYVGGRFGCTLLSPCDFNPGAGTNLYSSNGDLDAFISKFDSSGNFIWAKTWGGSGWDAEAGLTADNANNVYVTGLFTDTVDFGSGSGVAANGLRDAFLSEFDANGNFQGAQTWGGSGDDIGNKLIRDAAGNTYVVGWFQNTVDFNPGSGGDNHTAIGGSDAFVSKFLPSLKLGGTPGNQMIYLNWQVNVTLPVTTTWTISYTGGPGSPASPITGLAEPTRAYTITQATNSIWYDMTLIAMVNGLAVFTDAVRVMPTRLVYLPLIMRQ